MIAKKFKTLSLALIFSVALNIGLVAYFLVQDAPIAVQRGQKRGSPVETTNGGTLAMMASLSFRELVSFLTNRSLVEDGYSKRDLAVAALTAYRHFNLEKALCGKPEQAREFHVSKGEIVEIYPNLTEDQFEAIIRFAYQEKWPLTARGLFLRLQNREEREESLEQAFFHTPEFYAVKQLFQKPGVCQEPHVLLNFIGEGSWELLESVTQEASQGFDCSDERRRALLLNYVALHSPTAAKLLLEMDFDFALKKLDDRGILQLLALLKQQTDLTMRFCVELLKSPRSSLIWDAAAMTLYSYVGEIPIQPIDHKTVLAKFSFGEDKASAPPPVQTAPAVSCYHVVGEGETLWKISRTYKVKVEEIVQLNGLEKDALYPGMTLKLPPK
ncbi:MAG: hypothetical protein ACD_17C00499G0002 [uncultured bacterium]|nr:MAG: hypothetical protein ACD_17C00499G0002 [uncultured bacterium]OGN55538.1 MAG: hypothetical protein A2796_05720 [Chlamydiae bacterium RIFCSPHIGHO2_01_FULL_44_39]OGN57749.1 MAG: hypothetical protein A3C42_04300 [Chlamydiae bacterium RIFCSPHIGHO2_02_FULL_45_9]OGN60052.1 MAG: hypothetical protein A3D96_04230 [Chlamydiae bacterium RIFCSPHIGHO2_12_FULL_44_59]OGN66225.1 MAG: hypothetical protein A2978_06225 [Chlamydiae bacterium RIFCSPLOWO2_01_FULL_44_52]OGN68497.1 MAG: hypothetical protein A3